MRALRFALLTLLALASVAVAVPVLDTTTQGTWVGVYGSQGYILPAYDSGPTDRVVLPSYISSAPIGGARWQWTTSTSDVRAVQNPSNPSLREATCAYNGGSLNMTLNLSQPAAFTLGLYILDWDSQNRQQRITMTGQPTVTDPAFASGHWYRYRVASIPSIPINIQFTQLATQNAVLNAVTFDPLNPTPILPAVDTATQGNWLGVYGDDGYILPAFLASGSPGTNADDLSSLGSWVSGYSFGFHGGGSGRWQWSTATSEARALVNPLNTSNRRATCAFDNQMLDFLLQVTKPVEFDISLYLLDWDSFGRSQTELFLNPASDPYLATGYHNGVWLTYHVYADPSSSLDLRSLYGGGANAVLSAVTFDNLNYVPEPATLTLLALGGLGLLRRRRTH